MNEDISNYDSGALSPDENKPIKTFSRRTKLTIRATAILIAALVIAGMAFYLINSALTGASDPGTAASEYLKASLSYDAESMVKYSSPYNKIKLGDGETSDRYLVSLLNKAYEGKEKKHVAPVVDGEPVIYTEGDDTFGTITANYSAIADASAIQEAAMVKIRYFNGTITVNLNYYLVKIGSRWYFYNNTP